MNSSNPLETARDLYFSGKFLEAVEIWNELAEKGDIEAKAWLGSCYANGDGVGLDDSIALGYFEEAATGGNALAQANAGAFHFMGRGTSKNTEKAVKWLEMAAANNDLNGLFNLAQIYFQGSGVEVDYEKSANFYQKAAELGHYPSQARLGQMYINGHGVEKSRAPTIFPGRASARSGTYGRLIDRWSGPSVPALRPAVAGLRPGKMG